MVKKSTDKNLRDCECMINKNEVKNCENNEIMKREVCESIAEVNTKIICKEQKKNKEKQ